ncbi:hypothetical protein [Mastigocoleus testarum]|uniref:Uncharacterized protein n=1 Tax=Mastigocoleus testarum BC008 TaxID=371196 RepID=A0A0V7ZGC8_9CYAN|nr:hypothetical protein [Mastigocoleus testarum]KST63487.1 hypothetical protein BC008_13570 [Mastigocoleus testarum BC008]
MLFSAIGVLAGNITQKDDKLFISIQDKEYPLFYSKYDSKKINQSLTSNSSTQQRISVYPKISHSNKKDKVHTIKFRLLKFEPEISNTVTKGILQTFEPNEFKIFGLWQFLQQCQTPVISVYRNFDQYRFKELEKLEPKQQTKRISPSHLPVMWENPPVQPVKLNSKQQHPYFVQVKAKFNPTTDIFEFDSLLSEPTKECPEYFKPNYKKTKSKEESKTNHEERSVSTAA